MSQTFAYCEALKRIPLLKVNQQTTWTNTFFSCKKLQELNIEGTIGQNNLNLKDSTELSKNSMTSVINALSTTTSGLSVTFSKTARTNAFTDDEWAALIATKPNWTINLL
jgi:hypothetical protein